MAMRVRLQDIIPYLTYAAYSLPCPLSLVAYLTHVSNLSVWVLPYRAGYGFPLPFGSPPSLLGSSCPAGGFAVVAVGLLA
jgi:hypothetical protein